MGRKPRTQGRIPCSEDDLSYLTPNTHGEIKSKASTQGRRKKKGPISRPPPCPINRSSVTWYALKFALLTSI
jgi:hypothetical protein